MISAVRQAVGMDRHIDMNDVRRLTRTSAFHEEDLAALAELLSSAFGGTAFDPKARAELEDVVSPLVRKVSNVYGQLETNDDGLSLETLAAHGFMASIGGATRQDAFVALTIDGVRVQVFAPAGTPGSTVAEGLADEFFRATGFQLGVGEIGGVSVIDEGFPGFDAFVG
jgi:hypothetical protein